MSELPWESGKSKNDRSADADPSTQKYPWDTNDPDKGDENVTNNLPDLLTNAFDDVEMEEIDIEPTLIDENKTPSEAEPFASPSFTDVPDLSNFASPMNDLEDTTPQPETTIQVPPFGDIPDISNIKEQTPLDIDTDTIHTHLIESNASDPVNVIDATNEKIPPDGLNPDFQTVIPITDSDGTFQSSPGVPPTIETDEGKTATLPLFEPDLPDENTGFPHVETGAQIEAIEQDPFKQMQPPGMETGAQMEAIEQDPFKQMQPPGMETGTQIEAIEQDPFKQMQPPGMETGAQIEAIEQDPFKQMQPKGEEGVADVNPEKSNISISVSDQAANVSNIINNLKGFLRKITRGKKLIDRVEDMRETLEIHELENVPKAETPVSVSTPANTSTAPPTTVVPPMHPTPPSEPVPEEIETENIRTVIPIAKEVVERHAKEIADGTSPFA
ncbi:MAG: hypothetical protein ACXQTE_01055, partial [Methanosarcinaceae archaeon]